MNSIESLDPFDADVTVEQWEWRKASPPQTIGTIGLGPCIGVTAYNPVTKEGFVGHFVDPIVEQAELNHMLIDYLAGTEPSEIKVWVHGGAIVPYDRKGCLQSRDHVVALLSDLGIRGVDVEWNESLDETIGLILDCKTGKFSSIREC